jgi:hypothetical protein
VNENTSYAQALARHVKAALLHLRQAEKIAEAAGTDLDASEHDAPEAGLFRAAGDATGILTCGQAATPAPRAPAQPVPTGTPKGGATPRTGRCPPGPGRLTGQPGEDPAVGP